MVGWLHAIALGVHSPGTGCPMVDTHRGPVLYGIVALRDNSQMGAMRALLVLGLASSCDYVFRLDHVEDPTVGSDAGPCTPVGHDEDGDGTDDACDACPQRDEAQADEDSDGVGNLCDPNPSEKGDRLVRFFSFGTPDRDLAWSRDSEWTFNGDDLLFTGLAAESYAELLDPMVVPPFEVQVAVTLEAVDLAQRAYFVINGNDGPGIKLECSPEHASLTTDIVTAYTHSVDSSGYEEVDLPSDSYAPGKRFLVRLTARTGTNPRMICTFDGGVARSATALINAQPSTTPVFNLVGRNSVLRVHWLAIYSIPPS